MNREERRKQENMKNNTQKKNPKQEDRMVFYDTRLKKYYKGYIKDGHIVIDDEEYEKDLPFTHPVIEKIGENLFRTTILENGDVFIGDLPDTIDVLNTEYENVAYDFEKFILDNCERLSLEDYLDYIKQAEALYEKYSCKEYIRYRCGNKIFICQKDDTIDKMINDAEIGPSYNYAKTIKWEKRNQKENE